MNFPKKTLVHKVMNLVQVQFLTLEWAEAAGPDRVWVPPNIQAGNFVIHDEVTLLLEHIQGKARDKPLWLAL